MLLNPFPHTTNLQQMTLNKSQKKIHAISINNSSIVENIVANGEIALHEQFLLLQQCFSTVVCCRDVRKRLYVGKGKHHSKSCFKSLLKYCICRVLLYGSLLGCAKLLRAVGLYMSYDILKLVPVVLFLFIVKAG